MLIVTPREFFGQHSSASQSQTFGVVVGISDYEQKKVPKLLFASQDALAFYNYLTSPRGGALKQNVVLLLDQRARLDDIRTAIRNAFRQAGTRDTVVLFIAAHGIAPDGGPNRIPYILAVNSNPENLAASGLPMEDIQILTPGPVKAHNVRVFIDACHSGIIGSISGRANRFATDLMDPNAPVVFGFMASAYGQLSYECSNYQHGAFTYFLLKGLNSAEAADQASGRVTGGDLVAYVTDRVYQATARQQRPVPQSQTPPRLELANIRLPGIDVPKARSSPSSCLTLRGRDVAGSNPVTTEEPPAMDAYSVALRQGRILPGKPGSAFDMLSQRTDLQSPIFGADRIRLLIALEDAGQDVLLSYLRGEEVPQSREDFERGEQYFTAARTLAPDDTFVDSRRLFCLGRKLIFDGDYRNAINALKQSIQLYPPGSYSNNAIGIAYLQSGDFPLAIAALRDSIALAPYWAYPKHNLALALQQAGLYQDAIATYNQAMSLVPNYAYIPYNLGLLLQRLNRVHEARDAWTQSLVLDPNSARTWNALGLSYYLDHRYEAAEKRYLQALKLARSETDEFAVRHDLALLRVAQRRESEAIQLWRENLNSGPNDVPSLIGISQALVKTGRFQEAAHDLSTLIEITPRYPAARILYAKVLIQQNNPEGAIEQFRAALQLDSRDARVYELLADATLDAKVRGGSGSNTEIHNLYQRALDLSVSRAQRKRIQKKIAALH